MGFDANDTHMFALQVVLCVLLLCVLTYIALAIHHNDTAPNNNAAELRTQNSELRTQNKNLLQENQKLKQEDSELKQTHKYLVVFLVVLVVGGGLWLVVMRSKRKLRSKRYLSVSPPVPPPVPPSAEDIELKRLIDIAKDDEWEYLYFSPLGGDAYYNKRKGETQFVTRGKDEPWEVIKSFIAKAKEKSKTK